MSVDTSTKCGCGTSGSGTNGSVALERPRFFPRQLIAPSDLTQGLDYFLDKLRRHNRLLHGWGVVCGAKVCPVYCKKSGNPEPWKVKVSPGYILGPYGDEIVIDHDCPIDLRRNSAPESGSPGADPWC